MVFGTPGGDSQDQWTLQFFLNHVDFKMNLQEAIDAPSVHSLHFPSSFYPRAAFPGEVAAEDRIPASVLEELERRGHRVSPRHGWSNGKVLAIRRDGETGVISGGGVGQGEHRLRLRLVRGTRTVQAAPGIRFDNAWGCR